MKIKIFTMRKWCFLNKIAETAQDVREVENLIGEREAEKEAETEGLNEVILRKIQIVGWITIEEEALTTIRTYLTREVIKQTEISITKTEVHLLKETSMIEMTETLTTNGSTISRDTKPTMTEISTDKIDFVKHNDQFNNRTYLMKWLAGPEDQALGHDQVLM